ncbi:hypothetical protein [Solibacillus sp. FSL H8-0538]|uniref:hypothetical protein n=1 Tax=Solibacillus sp. FSL H8-0538 TaxID=2921400 RepID=UPI0030F63BDB
MYRIKKGKITLIGTIGISFVVTFLFINNSSTKEETSEAPHSISPEIQAENEKKRKEVEEIQMLLYQENGFFEQVNKKLKEKGYVFHMLLAIYSKDDIRVKYILANKDVTESAQEEVKTIFYELVENTNLDSNSYNLKVGGSNEGPDW